MPIFFTDKVFGFGLTYDSVEQDSSNIIEEGMRVDEVTRIEYYRR